MYNQFQKPIFSFSDGNSFNQTLPDEFIDLFPSSCGASCNDCNRVCDLRKFLPVCLIFVFDYVMHFLFLSVSYWERVRQDEKHRLWMILTTLVVIVLVIYNMSFNISPCLFYQQHPNNKMVCTISQRIVELYLHWHVVTCKVHPTETSMSVVHYFFINVMSEFFFVEKWKEKRKKT